MLALVTVALAGNLVRFDGYGDYVSFDDLDPGTTFTVETWVWMDAVNTFNTVIEAVDADGLSAFYVGYINGQWQITIQDNSEAEGDSCAETRIDNLCAAVAPPTAFHWFHLAVSVTPTQVILYVDGVAAATQDVQSSPAFGGLTWGLGSDTDNGSDWTSDGMTARLDELRIWSEARTADELLCTLDWQLSGEELGLYGVWHFDERNGTPDAYDSGPRGKHGRLHGDTTFGGSNAGSAGALTNALVGDISCFDYDGDGFSQDTSDCDGDDATIFPGAPEIGGDGIDQDCDGVDAEPDTGTDSGTDSGTDTDTGITRPPGRDPHDPNGGINTPGNCGCGGGAPVAGLLPALLLLASRRRYSST